MQIFKEIQPLREHLRHRRSEGVSIGFVPTMGALHEGHLELIRATRGSAGHIVASIFVNPTQFNNPSDLEKYPRTLEKDIELLKTVSCDVLFAPEVAGMYEKPATIHFDFGQLDKVLEGKFRPGHFSGVATVVGKLFNIVEPDVAAFGQKDYQQLQVITRLVEELKFNIRLIPVPTLREPDGLAMSSRNTRLSPQQRKTAVVLHQSLASARQRLLDGTDWSSIQKDVQTTLSKIADVQLEYFELAHRNDLTSTLEFDKREGVILMACNVGPVRLIDNMLV